MAAIELDKSFGYVLGVAAASVIVHQMWMPMQVSNARKKYGIKYPDLYATPENCKDEKARTAFNCVQRAHQNSIENYAPNLAMLLVAGIKYPITAAALGGIFILGRVMYFAGYSSGDPAKRYRGGFWAIGFLGLLGTVCKMTYDFLKP